MLHQHSMPLLAGRVLCRRDGGDVIVETQDLIYTFSPPSSAIVELIIPALDGSTSVSAIASRIGVQPAVVAAVLDELNSDAVLALDVTRARGAATAAEFGDALKEECRFWSREILSRPFWQTMQSGEAPKAVVLGWGIEFYHFVNSVNEYMAAGVANCRLNASVRDKLVKHYIEESEHASIFLQGLTRCGLDPDQVAAAPPLVCTRSLIDYLCEIALTSSVSYAAMFALMHANEAMSQDAVEAFYAQLARAYPFAEGLFDACLKHALIDVRLEHHHTVFDAMLEDVPDTVLRHGPEAVIAVRGLAEQFMLFFDGILTGYTRPLAAIPRRPFDLVDVS
jgi:pyrroloquinoline quinone (PQQ) biosynthesis protein C